MPRRAPAVAGAWLRVHPVAGFVLLAFAITYLIGMPLLMVGMGMIPERASLTRTYLPRVLVTYGPGIAAVLLASLAGSRGDVARLLRRLRPQSADVPWVAAIVAICAASSAIALLVTGVRLEQILGVVRDHGGLLLAHLVLQLIVVAVGEELGWRGWLLPAVMERASRIRAALVVGGWWALWHFPLLASGVTTAIMLITGALGLSVLFTHVTVRRENRVFAVVVAHAAVNTPFFFWEQVAARSGLAADQIRTAWYLVEGGYAVAAIVLVAARWGWWTERVQPPGSPEQYGEARPAA